MRAGRIKDASVWNVTDPENRLLNSGETEKPRRSGVSLTMLDILSSCHPGGHIGSLIYHERFRALLRCK